MISSKEYKKAKSIESNIHRLEDILKDLKSTSHNGIQYSFSFSKLYMERGGVRSVALSDRADRLQRTHAPMILRMNTIAIKEISNEINGLRVSLSQYIEI